MESALPTAIWPHKNQVGAKIDAILFNLATNFFFRSRLLFLFLDGTWWNIKEEIFNFPTKKPFRLKAYSWKFLKIVEFRVEAEPSDQSGTRCDYVKDANEWGRHLLKCLCGSAHNILYSYIASKVYFVVHDSCKYLLSMAWFFC